MENKIQIDNEMPLDDEITIYDETTFLERPSNTSNIIGYIISCTDSTTEKYQIKDNKVYIGRNYQICNFIIKKKTIGRLHAHIVYNDGKLLLYDKNSKNGTFINGNRLEPEKGYELADGDTIMFADEEYKFVKSIYPGE
jgi:pSer/pThr/pTyr-binding forkhead associated (FHA) protein